MTVRGRKVKGRGGRIAAYKCGFYCFSTLSICANFSKQHLLVFYHKALGKIKIFEKHVRKRYATWSGVANVEASWADGPGKYSKDKIFIDSWLTNPPTHPPCYSLLPTLWQFPASRFYTSPLFPFWMLQHKLEPSTRGLPINAFIRFHMKICFKKLLLIYLLSSCQSIHSRGKFTNNY